MLLILQVAMLPAVKHRCACAGKQTLDVHRGHIDTGVGKDATARDWRIPHTKLETIFPLGYTHPILSIYTIHKLLE